jgi:hypothetical protein
VRDVAAFGELSIPHKSNAEWRLEACTRGPSLAFQASLLAILQLQNTPAGGVNHPG